MKGSSIVPDCLLRKQVDSDKLRRMIMEKRIGILTFHRADNLGAVLQAYALSKYITESIGVTAEIVDYKCETVESTRYAHSGNFVTRIPLALYYKIKRNGFDRFRKEHLSLSATVYTKDNIAECNQVYSTFIAGSDQIWNTGCSGNDATYFLDFADAEKIKIAYAASMGAVEFTRNEIKTYTEYLSRFKAISVREQSSINKLNLSNDTMILPDPVFLLDKKQWEDVAVKKNQKKKYVFVYLIQEDVNVLNAATKYARQHDCEIVINKKSIDFIMHNAPDFFLGWIDNAEAVFTNSFHGTAFSIIFQKRLAADIALKNGGTNNRINELLCSAGLEQCIISEKYDTPERAKADEWLKAQKNNAKNFLMSNI